MHLLVVLNLKIHQLTVHKQKLLPKLFVRVECNTPAPTKIEHLKRNQIFLGLNPMVDNVVVAYIVCKLNTVRSILE